MKLSKMFIKSKTFSLNSNRGTENNCFVQLKVEEKSKLKDFFKNPGYLSNHFSWFQLISVDYRIKRGNDIHRCSLMKFLKLGAPGAL